MTMIITNLLTAWLSPLTIREKEIEGKTMMELVERDVFLSVARNTKTSVVVSILKGQEQAVLVIEKGEIVRIITKHDLLSKTMRWESDLQEME